MSFQSAATNAAPTSGVPLIHEIETIMALESGLLIDPVLYDLVHGPQDAYIQNIGQYPQQQLDDLIHAPLNNSIQNIGQYQHQQPLRQQINAYDPGQPNNAYNAYNQTQHPDHATTTPTLPNTKTSKSPGPNVGQPIPPHLFPLIAALRALPHVSLIQAHPVRSTLKNPFTSDDLTAPHQLLIRANFISGAGTLQPKSELTGWYEDEAVFPKAFWRYFWKGEPRAKSLKRAKNGGGKRQKREEPEPEVS
jgi:hypothetical protein